MLVLKKISARTLKDINFEVKPSEKMLILGPSGCGKSTLLSLIKNEIYPDAGSVNNNFKNTQQIYQDLNLILSLSAKENAEFVLNKNQMTQFIEIIKSFELAEDLISKKIKFLSFGQRQKVSVALALASEPELLLADEPTSHLDPESSLKVFETILKLSKSLILVSHDHRFKKSFNNVLEL